MTQDSEKMDFQKSSVHDLLLRFQAAQTNRAQTYALLNEGFRDLLKSKNEAPFTKIMSEATRSFKICSDNVRQIEKVGIFDAL